MQAHGSDRVRASGENLILLSLIPKAWTARVPKTGTHSEFPGTTVVWEEQYFEVVEASAQPGGAVRYVLAPWREEHTIRTFESYDAESEALRLADHRNASRQRKSSAASRWLGMILGHLPQPVQSHLENEMGVRPAAMTIVSCIPPMIFVGTCLYLNVGAMMSSSTSPVPAWLTPLLGFFTLESVIRFYVAMSQNRGMGSALGTAAYIAFWIVAGGRAPVSPFAAKGESSLFTIPPPDDVALSDSLELKGPLLTLLPAVDQRELARLHGYDYRRNAFTVAWTILLLASAGAFASWKRLDERGAMALISMLAAAAVAAEQLFRLVALRRGPAGCSLGWLVRPFARDLLTARN
jgi:hypothetical protein